MKKTKKKLAAATNWGEYYKVPTTKPGGFDVYNSQGLVKSWADMPAGANIDLIKVGMAPKPQTMNMTPTPEQNQAAMEAPGMATASGRTKYKLIGGKLVKQ
jgi:hypothetical protein